MTALAGLLLAVAAVAAVANWWSKYADHRPTELWSKPVALLALIGVAVALDPVDATVRTWFVVALALSLAGDVFLLGTGRWFLAGLASFLAAHLAYIGGFVAVGGERWWALIPAVAVVVVLSATAGRRIVAGAGGQGPTLRGPVVAYLGVISAMVLVASVTGTWLAIAGALLFLASDTVLGWREFVERRQWMPLTVIVTYHLAQASLVLSLV